jgi:preprotein translocase subunit SecG
LNQFKLITFFVIKNRSRKNRGNKMVLALQILQILSGVMLIFLVLLHAPKGAGLGSIGGAAQLFSSQQSAESSLNKITYWTAGVFLVVSLLIGLGIIK